MRTVPAIQQAAKSGRDILDQARPAPNGGSILTGWFTRLALTVITKTLVNGDLVEASTTLAVVGIMLATGKRDLEMMPEGQRSWEWSTLYTQRPIVLRPDDKVVYQGVTRRVMKVSENGDYGECKYYLVHDYQV